LELASLVSIPDPQMGTTPPVDRLSQSSRWSSRFDAVLASWVCRWSGLFDRLS